MIIKKFKSKILLLISIIVLVIVSLSYFFNSKIIFTVLKSDIKEELKKNVNFIYNDVDQKKDQLKVKGIIALYEENIINILKDSANEFELKYIIGKLSTDFPNSYIKLYDMNGNILARSPNTPAEEIKFDNSSANINLLSINYSKPAIYENYGKIFIVLFLKIRKSNSMLGGILLKYELSDRYLDNLKQEYLSEELRQYFVGDIGIYDSNLNVISTTKFANDGKRKKEVQIKKNTNNEYFFYEDDNFISYFKYYSKEAIWIEVSFPMNRLKQLTLQKKIIGLNILMVIFTTFILYIVLAKLLIPINKIIEGINIVKEGNFKYKIDIRRNDDMGKAIINFNEMVNTLEKNKEIEARYARLDKIASIGRLAAGVAHEIKNPLSSISMITDMYCQEFESIEFHKEDFVLISKEINRINEIIENLLKLSKDQKINFEYDNVVDIIRSMVNLTKKKAQENENEISLETNKEIINLKIDTNMFKQLILNLIINSIDATKKGKIEIIIVEERDDVLIIVKDSGKGMTKEVLEKVMEPFYTTKTKGTGIGLAIVRKIIDLHNFEYRINSVKDKGTEFYIKIKKSSNDKLKVLKPYNEDEILERRD